RPTTTTRAGPPSPLGCSVASFLNAAFASPDSIRRASAPPTASSTEAGTPSPSKIPAQRVSAEVSVGLPCRKEGRMAARVYVGFHHPYRRSVVVHLKGNP